MKTINGAVLSVSLILLLPIISVAEQRMITFEMGESGHLLSFPMTQKEIVAAERIDAVIEKIEERKRHRQQTFEHSFELAESGIEISFPMSVSEAISAKEASEKIAINHNRFRQMQEKLERGYEIYEMGESGQTIKFKMNSNEYP